MTLVRAYVAALSLVLFAAFVTAGQVGVLQMTVSVLPLIHLIIDMREELRQLPSLEAKMSSLCALMAAAASHPGA